MTPSADDGKPPVQKAGSQAEAPQPAAPKEKPSSARPDNQPESQPEPKPAAESPEQTAPLPGTTVTINTERFGSKDFKVVGTEIQNSYHFENRAARFEVFSFDMATELPISQEEAHAKVHIHDERITVSLLERLQDRRVLFLYGEPNAGKDSTALFLSHLLRTCDGDIKKPVLLVPPLESRLRINLTKTLQDIEASRGRSVVFRNVLDRGNRDLKDFLGRIDESLSAALSARLKIIGSFLVFTATDRTILDEIQNLESIGIAALFRPPAGDILRLALKRALSDCDLSVVPSESDIKSVEKFGRTVPRVFYCVRKHVSSLRESLSISEAFSRIDDIETWFLRELPNNGFLAWRFAFCLALGQPLPGDQGIPWAELTELLAALTPVIQEIVGTEDTSKSYSRDKISEDCILQDVRAVIDRDPAVANDVVRFQDTTYSQRIWGTILQHNRVILSACLAILERCAQRIEISPLAARALRIIGRIGEIDPGSYLWPLVERWSVEAGFVAQIKIGLLFEGAFATENALYTKNCERWLLRLASSQENGQIMAAVAICKQIGVLRIPLALRVLRQIAEKNLAEPLEDTQRIEKLLLRIEREHSEQQQENGTALLLEAYHELLADLARRVYAQQIPLIVSMRYALTSLFLEADPIQLIRELHQWGVTGGTSAALFSLLYLAKDGIANRLAADESDKVGFTEEHVTDHPILIAMFARKDACTDVANFLEDIYNGFHHFFPPASARFFRKAYFEHLTELIKSVLRARTGENELRAVIVLLLRSINGDLSMSCHQFLSSEEICQESAVEEFARSVLKAALIPRITPRSPYARASQR